jgi:hypothetical protein
MGLSGFPADVVPEFVDGLVALVRENENVLAMRLRDFQVERRKDQRPICRRQMIKFDHGRTRGNVSLSSTCTHAPPRFEDAMSDCDNPISRNLSAH